MTTQKSEPITEDSAMIKTKRIYDDKADSDGYRILIDRLWPRGVSKERAGVDLWLKEIAPSTELRKWYDHDPEKWEEFEKLYKEELKDKAELINQIKELEKKHKTVTLLYAAKDSEHANAAVLAELL